MASAAETKPAVHDPDLVNRNEAIDAEKKSTASDLDQHHTGNPLDHAITAADREHYAKYGTFDRYEITEEDCYDELGFCFPTWKKWTILSIVFMVQVSMNFNTSLYSNGVTGISAEFGVSAQAARLGAAIFLITYAFGCELWAPWSEELGRWPILQLSLFFVNIWQIPVAIAPNFGTILAFRALGGLSTAGGSVTLAMVADMWEPDNQQYAVAFIVFSSVGGSVLGPIVGGFVEQFLAWRWNIWIQLIFGVAVQIAHFIFVPETRTTILLDRIAKKRRTEGDKNGKPNNIWGPNELKTSKERFSVHEILTTWIRPFRMFVTEPIVLVLSLLSGFSDAIIFMFLQSYALVYEQWDFPIFAVGLTFVAIGIGYFIAWFSFFPAIKRNERLRRERPDDERSQYEARLWWLLYTAPCLPIGLIIFAWTSTGPPIHWMGSLVGSAIIGIANYAIYMATIDYMICAYGPYSASATGGNGWARDFLAGVLTLPATPFFQNIGGENHLAYASTILFGISLLLVVSVYVIYWKGPVLRKRSPFAQQLSAARDDTGGRRVSSLPGIYGSRANSIAQQGGSVPHSRRGSVVRGVPGGENRYEEVKRAKMQRKQSARSTNGLA
ncbi:ProP Permease of the major facilitator superfamily [Pyrenophora tritici-repentis]|uniref:Multidrug transporter n=2 Tax=Pyrenophora tritici-repentis TaxID=45151 RepID=A0A2W1D322_9PLEO|nr:multidrug transporter [Pyrenophora tritici-repentis Pt-1C-BFP]KAA8626936.1 Multidrug transporter [Pyrenophora tritici-repentis]EDU41651.1 multidrug transporter [Pyrenophora tritici-repentis Pt-1C-BFP]KAF7455373.1 Multidrug transporter [Pyrenophora tritici-repentis]KAF7578560.1 ProP, Permease major facilitator superfamily [Pyrenophora tritici-repentis]KAI0571087.1 Multidrug transporter [Pyrenophora tritici-repentis]